MTTTAAPPASSSTSTARPVCVDMNGVEREAGESWRQSCNTCTCSGGGPPVCTKMLCPPPVTVPPQPEPTTTIHVDPGSTSTDPLPCHVCSHCIKEVYDTFEKELALYEAMIQRLDDQIKKFRDNEKKFIEEIEKQKAKENQNLKYIQELEQELANFLARIQNLEDQNKSLKDDKNKLHAKIQDLEAENEQNNQNIQDLRAELVVFLERIQQLEDENKRLKDDNDILLDKIEELKSQSSLQTVLELLDKIKELEKNCKKPGCTNNTECPSWRACVRYYFPLKIQESLNSHTYLIFIISI